MRRIMEGAANNLPDHAALKAALEILRVCSSALEGEIVVAIISGGGSALLPCPIQGVELEEKRKVANKYFNNRISVNILKGDKVTG